MLLRGASTLPLHEAGLNEVSAVPSLTVMFLKLALSAVPASRLLLTRKVTDSTLEEEMGSTPYSTNFMPSLTMVQPLSWLS